MYTSKFIAIVVVDDSILRSGHHSEDDLVDGYDAAIASPRVRANRATNNFGRRR